jgi:hypothetical protein
MEKSQEKRLDHKLIIYAVQLSCLKSRGCIKIYIECNVARRVHHKVANQIVTTIPWIQWGNCFFSWQP